jgi:Primase C terminal 2 (PriCT-2)
MNISTKNSNNFEGLEMDNQIKFLFAVNRSGKNKDFNKEALTTDFKTTSGTLEDVRSEVSKGHALCAGILKEGKRRLADNIGGSHWVLIDIDNKGYSTDSDGNRLDKSGKITQLRKVNPKTGKETFSWVTLSGEPSFRLNDKGRKIPCMDVVDGVQRKVHEIYSRSPFKIEQALENPFIKEFGAIIYTTASHTPDWHKFRIILMLPEFVESEALKPLIKRVMTEFPEADQGCSDICRVFYGNTNAEFPLFNPDAYLPMEWVEEARKQAKKVSEVKSSKPIKKNSKNNEYEINRLWGALEHLDSDEYDTWIKYGMCLQSAEKPGIELGNSPEFQIWCEWSEGSPKYGLDGLEVCREKWSTFSADEGLELGSIFYDAVENGWIDPIGKKSDDDSEQDFKKGLETEEQKAIELETLNQARFGYKSLEQLAGRVLTEPGVDVENPEAIYGIYPNIRNREIGFCLGFMLALLTIAPDMKILHPETADLKMLNLYILITGVRDSGKSLPIDALNKNHPLMKILTELEVNLKKIHQLKTTYKKNLMFDEQKKKKDNPDHQIKEYYSDPTYESMSQVIFLSDIQGSMIVKYGLAADYHRKDEIQHPNHMYPNYGCLFIIREMRERIRDWGWNPKHREGNSLGLFCNIWDGVIESRTRGTANENTTGIVGRRYSILGGAQDDLYQSMLGNQETDKSGLLSRILSFSVRNETPIEDLESRVEKAKKRHEKTNETPEINISEAYLGNFKSGVTSFIEKTSKINHIKWSENAIEKYFDVVKGGFLEGRDLTENLVKLAGGFALMDYFSELYKNNFDAALVVTPDCVDRANYLMGLAVANRMYHQRVVEQQIADNKTMKDTKLTRSQAFEKWVNIFSSTDATVAWLRQEWDLRTSPSEFAKSKIKQTFRKRLKEENKIDVTKRIDVCMKILEKQSA